MNKKHKNEFDKLKQALNEHHKNEENGKEYVQLGLARYLIRRDFTTKMYPNNKNILHIRAQAFTAIGKYDEALIDLNRLLESNCNNEEII
ncbi:36212_t:CDS:2 [Gigaspora margarita]|uniref:36212_t:CDS:1 n=1 Tax=Gigaspora margarita TaxID=4874 RepID=A0ABN7UNN7_GIGMA|nr:36212_t:CDS:2 [Gigaspora margarita]